ncbi:hypothetical protein QF023_001417 [Chryseobacterium sp. SLBN-27]|uniref:hypothetical protein n=1 Tax=Chryseobacterium sp. SLBN-27 TaxID=3042287 RepID=UPI00285F0CF2|nr:hypothetical protein [Chryseobacterium sp. SLBN-27]MDR6157901.1 hypothetical protein [Chryseobacterium sp. SLBN-27]
MSVAKEYNLTFVISEMNDFIRPEIGVSNINGSSLYHEIASFLEPNGLEMIEHIESEIRSLDYNFEFKGINIWGYHDAESIEIRNFPPNLPVVIFNTGGKEVVVPVSDFLTILEEWRIFVEKVPKPHWLDKR